jgi:large subunit ribosomal protein L9
MDVILRRPVNNLGRAGEIVKVKPGYARNFLIPNGLAYEATEANKKRAAAEATRIADKLAADRESAESIAQRLAALELRFEAKSGEGDRLFGSITSTDLAERLAESGVELDKRIIELDHPIKTIGAYTVPVRLHPEVHGELKVWVDKAK